MPEHHVLGYNSVIYTARTLPLPLLLLLVLYIHSYCCSCSLLAIALCRLACSFVHNTNTSAPARSLFSK